MRKKSYLDELSLYEIACEMNREIDEAHGKILEEKSWIHDELQHMIYKLEEALRKLAPSAMDSLEPILDVDGEPTSILPGLLEFDLRYAQLAEKIRRSKALKYYSEQLPSIERLGMCDEWLDDFDSDIDDPDEE